MKYACPAKISVSLKQVQENIELKVTDNGKGFDPLSGKGNGLSNMKKRAEEIGGVTQIMSVPGEGTTILSSIPIKNVGSRKKIAG